MQWLVLVWALFVLLIYIGGFVSQQAVGIYTPESGKLYAVFLMIAVAASILRWLSSREAARKPAK